jgi:ABC-type glycerol-3-phosphate transport system substrate-binding protein
MIHKVITLFPFLAITFSLPTSPISLPPSSLPHPQEPQDHQVDISYDLSKAINQFQGSQETHDWSLTLTPSMSQRQSDINLTSNTYGYQDDHPSINQVWEFDNDNAWIEYEFEVESDILVQLSLDFFALDTSIRDVDLAIMVNGVYPFEDAKQLTFKKLWVTPHEFATDRYDNEIMPKAERTQTWAHQAAYDSQRLMENPLLWRLTPGMNTLRLYRLSGTFLLGQVYLQPLSIAPSYASYLNQFPSGILQTNTLLTYQAEHLKTRNSLLTRFNTNREPMVSPFALIEGKLNVLDGATYQTPGQEITYEVEVPASGFYHLTWKILQSRIQTKSFRRLRINGEVPFDQANTIAFDPSRQWQHQTLSDDEGIPYRFYLEAGVHQISLEVNASQFRSSFLAIQSLMNDINSLSLAIKKITGNTIDLNRDWDLKTYLPNIEGDLDEFMVTLDQVSDHWIITMDANQQSDVIASLSIARRLLLMLRNDVDSIPRRLETLSGASGSALYRLGIILPLMIQSPLTIDQFYVHGQTAILPQVQAGFFLTVWVGIQRFFASFFSDQYQDSTNPNELVVWVSRSRQFVNLLQQMVDAEFTPVTGIPVRININPNEDKLILASSAGKQPDIAMGIAGWRPYDFAIRNNVYDLSTFPDFKEVSNRFYPGSFLQLIYQDGVFGLPETQNFYLLFYRQDIMDRLDLEVPSTWDDVIGILPELQRFGMNFYSMLSSNNAFKAFVQTMPFIRQFGGKIFSDDGLQAAYDDPKTIDALTLMTDLFTTYSLPLEVGSFYNEFRYGRLPIGVGDFGMYISLLHAAPEIAGLWNIAPLPGVMQDGEVDRSFDGSSTSAMMFQQTKKPNEAWSFMKWWTSASIQLDYAENLISAYGPEYLWNSSNIEAFGQMSWDAQHRQTILDQWQWINDTAKTPASYMVERELSNIWNKVVFQGVNLRTAIEDSLIISNKEIRRKMIEFRFIDAQGNILKPYILPTKETIDQWIGLTA